jgi:glucokinase
VSVVAGFDIGGSKCAVSVGKEENGSVALLAREAFPTPKDQTEAIDALCAQALRLAGKESILSVGVSAGGPMDARKGVLMNPPNLPGWSGVSITREITARLGVPAVLGNDANACALAEWTWGAGKGSRTMVFLTFGTGLGAGIVIDGRILPGASDNAGELGHWRMADFGPSGYGKPGSLEGFCSGGGMAQLAQTTALKYRQNGQAVGMRRRTSKPWPRRPVRATRPRWRCSPSRLPSSAKGWRWCWIFSTRTGLCWVRSTRAAATCWNRACLRPCGGKPRRSP